MEYFMLTFVKLVINSKIFTLLLGYFNYMIGCSSMKFGSTWSRPNVQNR